MSYANSVSLRALKNDLCLREFAQALKAEHNQTDGEKLKQYSAEKAIPGGLIPGGLCQ